MPDEPANESTAQPNPTPDTPPPASAVVSSSARHKARARGDSGTHQTSSSARTPGARPSESTRRSSRPDPRATTRRNEPWGSSDADLQDVEAEPPPPISEFERPRRGRTRLMYKKNREPSHGFLDEWEGGFDEDSSLAHARAGAGADVGDPIVAPIAGERTVSEPIVRVHGSPTPRGDDGELDDLPEMRPAFMTPDQLAEHNEALPVKSAWLHPSSIVDESNLDLPVVFPRSQRRDAADDAARPGAHPSRPLIDSDGQIDVASVMALTAPRADGPRKPFIPDASAMDSLSGDEVLDLQFSPMGVPGTGDTDLSITRHLTRRGRKIGTRSESLDSVLQRALEAGKRRSDEREQLAQHSGTHAPAGPPGMGGSARLLTPPGERSGSSQFAIDPQADVEFSAEISSGINPAISDADLNEALPSDEWAFKPQFFTGRRGSPSAPVRVRLAVEVPMLRLLPALGVVAAISLIAYALYTLLSAV